ncbi:type II toxin-antitoxin system Phd/YefM family antitoxin [Planktothrix agardhii 1032]|jgi:prevent-host-death family protein|uniref:type II toxin-antitoxin system Phd/YefM family antitoxin n=1 Tax=Planktothrix agardhii TaxID=1160 RepID=UPI0004016672|nr:type II toxin-antitoxin system Phd/YefM family antitoxin [Planktothrix agardhii]MCB8776079.1 type II toxin-antitoxin system Phd/YefM family antitoxin [Planktothrix agardhii 1031]MCF3600412.1 type II toxin-antitoxin system Phd/YefM family antitoxin [Planktothrix agardhii 1032]CAD0228191.1 Antitoxin [Planktothrix agardhii]
MTNVDVTEIQGNFSELLSRVEQQGEKVVIEQNGQAVAVLISYEELKRLQKLEFVKYIDQSSNNSENDQELVTLEDVIQGYNALHGTDLTLENIIND